MLTQCQTITNSVRTLMEAEGWNVVLATPFSPMSDDRVINYMAISAKHKSPVWEKPSPEWETLLFGLSARKNVIIIEHEDVLTVSGQINNLLASGKTFTEAVQALLPALSN